ncbi:transposase [Salinibacter ruber]|nr:transposase [Salinibacter ruber]MCS3648148.1 transposase [Salinibacter ruber]
MPRTRPPYPEEFRDRIVELARNGRTPAELAEEFEPTEQTIRNWLKQTDRDDGNRSDGPTTEEKEEIRELRKKLRQVQQERDILANRCPFGTAWFAREMEDVPPKSSGSSGDVASP